MIIVTGATSGIGRAVALALASRSFVTAAVGRRQHLLDGLSNENPTLICKAGDLGSKAGLDSVFAMASDQDVTGIVHVAGTQIPPTLYSDLNVEELVADMAVHVGAPIELNNRLTPLVAGVLQSPVPSPTRAAFEKIQADGQLSEPEKTASFVVGLLIDATTTQLDSRDSWDFNKPEDHLF